MTRRVATPGACFQSGHDHTVLAFRLELDDNERWLTVWLCPVKRQLSALYEDGRVLDPARLPGGPLP